MHPTVPYLQYLGLDRREIDTKCVPSLYTSLTNTPSPCKVCVTGRYGYL